MKKLLVILVSFVGFIYAGYCTDFEKVLIHKFDKKVTGIATSYDGKVFVITDEGSLYLFNKTSDYNNPYEFKGEIYNFKSDKVDSNFRGTPVKIACSSDGKKIWVVTEQINVFPSSGGGKVCVLFKSINSGIGFEKEELLSAHFLVAPLISVALSDKEYGYILLRAYEAHDTIKVYKDGSFNKNIESDRNLKAITCNKAGDKVYCIDDDGDIKLLNPKDGRTVKIYSTAKTFPIGLKLTSDESKLIIYYDHSSAYFYDIGNSSLEEVRGFVSYPPIAVYNDNETLFTTESMPFQSLSPYSCSLWVSRTKKQPEWMRSVMYVDKWDLPVGLAISRDGGYAITSGGYVAKFLHGNYTGHYKIPNGTPTAISCTRDGKIVWVVSDSRKLYVSDDSGNNFVEGAYILPGIPVGVALIDNLPGYGAGYGYVTCENDNNIYMYHKSGQVNSFPKNHKPRTIACSANADVVWYIGDDKATYNHIEETIVRDKRATGIALSDDGKTGFVCSESMVYCYQNGEIKPMANFRTITGMACSADGNRMWISIDAHRPQYVIGDDSFNNTIYEFSK